MKRRLLYLPIETKARELHGKVLLASKAAECGWQVLMGPQKEIRETLPGGPSGAFIEISIPNAKAGKLAKYKSRGHRVANLCEESVVYYDALDYCRRKVGTASLEHVDVLLVAGGRNARDLQHHRPGSTDRIALTGNPRFDTLAPKMRGVFEESAAPIRDRFGRFLLVNTNFMRVNHFRLSADQILDDLQAQKAIADEAHADMLRRQYAYKQIQMDKLKPVLANIAASGTFENIVLRPHPSENHDSWREWATPLGIKVIFEGSANAWMLSADAILHTGCTTGIEGVLLDRPVASFVPQPGHEMLNQSDEISVQISDADGFLAYANQWRSRGAEDLRLLLQGQRATLASIIANVDPPMSVDRILDSLDRFDLPEVPVDTFRRPQRRSFSAMVARIRQALKGLPGSQKRRRMQWRKLYQRQKFPGLDGQDIMAPIAAWVDAGVLKRSPDVTRSHDGSWLFL